MVKDPLLIDSPNRQDSSGDVTGPDIVVRAKVADYQKASIGPSGGGNMNLNTYMVNVALQVDMPQLDPPVADSMKMVADGLHGIAAVIDGALNFDDAIGNPLPKGDRTRLQALAHALEVASTGLKTGSLKEDGAQALVKHAFTQFFDLAGGYGVGLAMSCLAAYASATAGPAVPIHVKALATAGAGVLGYVMESTLGNSGSYEFLAGGLTTAIFKGAEGLARVGEELSYTIDIVMQGVYQKVNPFSPIANDHFDPLDLDNFEVTPGADDVNGISSTYANLSVFDSLSSTDVEVGTEFYRSSEGGPKEVEGYVHSIVTPSIDANTSLMSPDILVM